MRQRLCKRTKFLFALADRTLRFDLIGDIDVRAEQTERFPLRIALDHRSGGNPACLAVARPDDTVAYRVLAITAPHRIDELPFGDRAIVGMNAAKPVLTTLVDGFERKAMYRQILGRLAIAMPGAQIDFEAADPPNRLHARELGLPFLQGKFGKMFTRDIA